MSAQSDLAAAQQAAAESAAALAAAQASVDRAAGVAAAEARARQKAADERLIAKYKAIENELTLRGHDLSGEIQQAVANRDLPAAYAAYVASRATRDARRHLRNAVASAEARNPSGATPLAELRYYGETFQDVLEQATQNAIGKQGAELADEILAEFEVEPQ